MNIQQFLYIVLIIVSVLLIAVVLLQSGKAESASAAISGGLGLFQERKERGAELFISRFTMAVGISFFAIAFILTMFF